MEWLFPLVIIAAKAMKKRETKALAFEAEAAAVDIDVKALEAFAEASGEYALAMEWILEARTRASELREYASGVRGNNLFLRVFLDLIFRRRKVLIRRQISIRLEQALQARERISQGQTWEAVAHAYEMAALAYEVAVKAY